MTLRSSQLEVESMTKVAQQLILKILRELQPEDFQDGETTLDREVKSSKPRVFISVDGGPDEAPKNQQTSACGRGNFKITTLILSLFSPMHKVAVLTIL